MVHEEQTKINVYIAETALTLVEKYNCKPRQPIKSTDMDVELVGSGDEERSRRLRKPISKGKAYTMYNESTKPVGST